VETIGSKRNYALTWCMPNNDDDDDDDDDDAGFPKAELLGTVVAVFLTYLKGLKFAQKVKILPNSLW